jgi:hypothetical protein
LNGKQHRWQHLKTLRDQAQFFFGVSTFQHCSDDGSDNLYLPFGTIGMSKEFNLMKN